VQSDAQVLPIFPLSNVVLFPHVKTPLHIFEPRYRAMTEHALTGDRRIAMVLVRPDHLSEMAGDAPVYPVGCAGTIEQFQRYPDGRYDIVLHGTRRIRIDHETARSDGRLFRSAAVEFLDDPCPIEDTLRVRAMREQVLEHAVELFGDRSQEISRETFDDIDDVTFVNVLCAALPFSAPEKQALIETSGIPERFEALIDVLSFARGEMHARRVPNSTTFH
jgi:hypothetical protein